MKVSEVKEKYLKLIKMYNDKYVIYANTKELIINEKDLMNICFEKLESEYDWYRTALKEFPEIEQKYELFCKTNKEEIDSLLKYTDEFEKISLLEDKIKDLSHKSKNATKTEYHTEYKREYCSEFNVALRVYEYRSKLVPHSVRKIVPDIDARKRAKEEMENLIKELNRNKYYNLYKNKHELLDNYFRLKNMFEYYKSALNYDSIEKIARRFVRHQNKCNEYIKEINKISGELKDIADVCKKIETELKKKWRFAFLKNNPVPNNEIETYSTTNLSAKQLLENLKNSYDEIEENDSKRKETEEEFVF